MNAPFVVAQAITTGQATPQIVKLTKPANGQAVSLQLDGNTRLDFSGIANERITLVRVGNQLVILFDNQTTVTIGGAYDPNGNLLDTISFDLGSGRIVGGAEFASLFPIGDNPNVLTAAGNGGPQGGFGGGDPTVDPLGSGNPLDLLGNEDGGTSFTIADILRQNNETTLIDPAPTAFSQIVDIDEDGEAPPLLGGGTLPGAVAGGPVNNSDHPDAPWFYTGGPAAIASPFGSPQPLFDFGSDGPALVDPIVFDLAALNALGLTSGGVLIVWGNMLNGSPFNGVIGSTAADPALATSADVVMGIEIIDLLTGDFSVGIVKPLDHAPPVGGVADENEIAIDFIFTLTDGSGTQATGTLTVNVDDDSPDPCFPVPGFVEELPGPPQLIFGNLDLEWGLDDSNTNSGPNDRSIAFISATPEDNVVATDPDGNTLAGLTSNGLEVFYVILGPAAQGDPVFLVAYTDPLAVPTATDDPNVVFWASLSDQNFGDWEFELRQPLDHPEPVPGGFFGPEHAIDLTFLFKAFDSDGDGVNGDFIVRVDAAGEVTFCGCGNGAIDYIGLPEGVFINLDNVEHTVDIGLGVMQTVAAYTATDVTGVFQPVIGIDYLGPDIINARGGDCDDIIIGGVSDNIIDGGLDNDVIIYFAGGGQDTVFGNDGDDRQIVYGSTDSETFNVNDVDIFGDFYVGINIKDGIPPVTPDAVEMADEFNYEVATLDVEDILIDTGAGADVVVVSGNLDGTGLATSTITIEGGSDDSNDIVDASGLVSDHGITFNGGGGDDYFYSSGALGDDTFDGGDGTDTIDFSAFGGLPGGVGVSVDLFNSSQDTNAGIDTITGVENVIGSSFNDVLRGDDSASNVLEGRGGNDTLSGGLSGGTDTLLGGEGDDVIEFTAGRAIVDGGEGGETLGDTLRVSGNAIRRDFVRISPDIDSDSNLDIDHDPNSGIDQPDTVELDVKDVEEIVVDTRDDVFFGDDNVVISGDLASTGVKTVRLLLNNANDTVTIEPTTGARFDIVIDGGEDNDIVNTGLGSHVLTFDGGDGNDLQNITGSAGSETFNVNLIDLAGVDHVGVNILAGIGAASEVLADGTNYEVATVNVEDIFIDTGAGDDVVIVTGSLNGTGLAQSTITVDTGAGNDTLDLRDRDSAHRVVVDGKDGTDTVLFDFARSSVTSVTEIIEGGVVIGAAITHTIGGQSVTDEFRNFENFTFTDGTLDLNTVFNQAPDAVDDALSTLVQYDFSGTVSARDGGVPWSSPYTFTLMVDASTRVATSFGYEIPLVASATLNLPYFSPDVIDIATPMRLGYNADTNRVFLTATGTGREDAYTIALTEPQENIFINQLTFGPLTGTAAQFNFIGLRDIIGSALPPQVVFTGGTVTAEVAASNGVKTEDTPFIVAVSSLTGNDSDVDGDPITFVSTQGAVGGTVSESGGYITFTPAANYFGAASFTYTIRDSAGLTDTATASFNINNVNDGPQLDLDSTTAGPGSVTIATSGGSAVQVTSPNVSIADVDDANVQSASLSIMNAQAGDRLAVGALPPGVTAIIDSNGWGVTLNGLASRADYEAAIEAVTFSTTNSSTTARNIAVNLYDGAGAGVGSVAQININTAPSITSVEHGDVTEDANATAGGSNLVSNGNFASYTLVPNSPAPGLIATLPGWTRQGTSPQADFDDFVSSVASLQINGLSNISQNITTVAGQRYELSFWHDGPTSQTTQAWFNGGLLIGATPLGANDPFRLYTVEFEGTGGPAELRFTQPGFGSSNLDDVVVRLISPPAQQTDSGTIGYNDPDGVGVPGASVAAQGTGYVGTFSIGAIAGNSVEWSFVADNSALQFLSANQTVTQTYAVTLTDNHGGSTTQNVTVQLHGVNDPVVITTNDGNLLEVSVQDEQTAATTIAASDVDINDPRMWSLSGTDATLFDISDAGVITFNTAPNFNAPSDSGANNVYDLVVSVTDGTVTETQAVAVTVNDGPFPSGTDKSIEITEDVMYTFTLADFGFSDTNGNAFAAVTVNWAVNSLPGHLSLGNFGLTPGSTIFASAIEAGRLTFTPTNDQPSGQGAFTFSVRDDGPSGQNIDPMPNTMLLTLTGVNQIDNEESGTDFDLTFAPSVLSGFQSFRDTSVDLVNPDFDRFVWNTSTDAFSNLEMTRSLDNLQITFTANTGSGVFSILNQYEVGNLSAIEAMQFADTVQFGAATLSGRYNLSAGNGGADDDIIVGGPGSDTRVGGDGQDVLFGAGGNDNLNGQGGFDILVGGLGNDTLTGGGETDTYRFAETGSAHRDTILDYGIGGQETLDLSALLDANFGVTGTTVSDFVRVQSTGADAVVQVDTDGAAGGANWQDVAVLSNYGSINNTVLVHFEQQAQQLTVA